jgi:acetyl esterase/lipase
MNSRYYTFIIVLLVSLSVRAYKLTPYIPKDNPTGTGVIVCPGGSYFWLDKQNEGYKVAQWLSDNGIAAFVLEYSHGGWASFAFHVRTQGRTFPSGFNDFYKAISYIRKNADNYGIDSNKIGAMGFSAGGHLVMSSVELFDKDDWPKFVVSVYPVVTMVDACVHKRSRRGLLGDSRTGNGALRDLLSLEKHVPTDCPPVFLVNCKDDPIVDYRNSVLLDSALTEKGVSHEYIQYKTGGHGFGVSVLKGSAESREWKYKFLEWLSKNIE